jgi:hypothetical protein
VDTRSVRRVRRAALKFATILERAQARSEARGFGDLFSSWREMISDEEIRQLYVAAKMIGRSVVVRDQARSVTR